MQQNQCGVQWLEIEELLVRASPPPESLCYILEQDTLSVCSTQKAPTGHDQKIVDWDLKIRHKQNKQSNKIRFSHDEAHMYFEVSPGTMPVHVQSTF